MITSDIFRLLSFLRHVAHGRGVRCRQTSGGRPTGPQNSLYAAVTGAHEARPRSALLMPHHCLVRGPRSFAPPQSTSSDMTAILIVLPQAVGDFSRAG